MYRARSFSKEKKSGKIRPKTSPQQTGKTAIKANKSSSSIFLRDFSAAGRDGLTGVGVTFLEAAEVSNNFNVKELQGSRDFDAWDEEKKRAESRFIVNALRREFFKERRTELTKMMRQAELAGDQEAVSRIGREFEEIMAQEGG